MKKILLSASLILGAIIGIKAQSQDTITTEKNYLVKIEYRYLQQPPPPPVLLDSSITIIPIDSVVKPPPTEPEPTPPIPGESIGLFHTDKELDIWRERSEAGPYKTAGDYSATPGGPGDWDRIVSWKNKFTSNPMADIWSLSNQSGCVKQNSPAPMQNGVNAKDAAFYSLVKNDPQLATQVKDYLITQSKEPSMDFTNRSMWCFNVIYDINPSFEYAEWLSRLVMAYDYTKESFSSQEKTDWLKWISDAAEYWIVDCETQLNSLFRDRPNQDYTLAGPSLNTSSPKMTHANGHKSYSCNHWYNNRRLRNVAFAAMAAKVSGNDGLLNRCKWIFKEWLMFAVFPDGVIADFYRSSASSPEAGYRYSLEQADCMGKVADMLHRSGDNELYNFITSEGAYESKGGNKSFLFVMQSMSQIINQTYPKIYAQGGTVGDDKYWIDGRDAGKIWPHAHWFAQYNHFYQDAEIDRAVRSWLNTGLSIGSTGAYQTWNGQGGIFPGKLIMYDY